MKGNQFTGNLTDLSKIAAIQDVEMNWVIGTLEHRGKTYNFQAKIFAEPSSFGINDGRISKLSILNGKKWRSDTEIFNYDRGYDFGKKSGIGIAKLIVNAIDGTTETLDLDD